MFSPHTVSEVRTPQDRHLFLGTATFPQQLSSASEDPERLSRRIALRCRHSGTQREVEFEFSVKVFGGGRLALRELDAPLEMFYRFGIGGTAECEVAGLEPVIDGAIREIGLREVACEKLRFACNSIEELFFECSPNPAVQLLPTALEQAFVSCVLHQNVFEAVHALWGLASAEHELCLLEVSKCIDQHRLVAS